MVGESLQSRCLLAVVDGESFFECFSGLIDIYENASAHFDERNLSIVAELNPCPKAEAWSD
jgi:hypothetical protein